MQLAKEVFNLCQIICMEYGVLDLLYTSKESTRTPEQACLDFGEYGMYSELWRVRVQSTTRTRIVHALALTNMHRCSHKHTNTQTQTEAHRHI